MDSLTVDELLLKLRIELAKKGSNVLVTLLHAFHNNDEGGQGLLSYAEFEQVLARMGLFLPLTQLTLIARKYDLQSNRLISVAEFMKGLAGEPNQQRKQLIRNLYSTFSTAAAGYVLVDEIRERFCPEYHPKVRTGDKTATQVANEFENNIQAFSADGKMFEHQFWTLFTYISAACPLNDDFFAAIVDQSFKHVDSTGHATGEHQDVDAGYLQCVGQVLKEKIRQKTRGQESEAYTLTRVFRHFDLEDTGTVNFPEWSHALERFGILMPEKESAALFMQHDKARHGRISYANFVESLYGPAH